MPPIPFAAVTHYAAAVGRIRLPVCIILRLLSVPFLLHILPQSETHLRNANFPAPTGDTEAMGVSDLRVSFLSQNRSARAVAPIRNTFQ